MRLTFIRLYMEMDTKTGGFTETELKQMEGSLTKIVDSKLKSVTDWQKDKDEADKENQKAIDTLLTRMKNNNGALNTDKKSFGQVLSEGLEEKRNDLEYMEKSKDKDAKVRIELKQVGDMALSTNLTGDSQQTYSQRQGLVPNQKINFRDLIPTTQSATGQYVHYRETGSEGAVDLQTEGSGKSQIDYDLTEIKTVTGYIAGYARFSKQMAKNLPWMQTTLPRLLMRDFYKKENANFWDILATNASGFSTTFETDDAKQIIDILMGRADLDFNNSFILCKNAEVGRLLKLLYTNGYYQGAGSVIGNANGSVQIAGVPVIGVSWARSGDKIAVIDNDFIERVEAEVLAVEFSYEDYKNFTENKITARVECFENLNLLRTDAHSYVDMGNSASS